MSLKVTAVNLALIRIGVSNTIAGLDEQSREAFTASAIIDHEFRAVLRQFPWAFATKYLDLTLVSGTVTVPVNADWQYSYTYPADCLLARRIVDGARRGHETDPIQFRVGREDNALIVYTDEVDACLEYTAVFDCPEHLGDELFVDAFAWRLAAAMAPSLSRIKGMAETAYQMFLLSIDTASAVSSREQQQAPQGEAEWIAGR